MKMVDYVKFVLRGNAVDAIRLNKSLTKEQDHVRVNQATGEEFKNSFYSYRGLSIKVCHTGLAVVTGSLHKYKNNGVHNHDDFYYDELTAVLKDVSNVFNIQLADTQLSNIEFGVNLNMEISPSNYIDRIIILLANSPVQKSPITQNDCKGFQKGIRFDASEYSLKIYNKSKQYNLAANILRIEFKTYRLRYIEKSGIRTLADLLNKEKLSCLSELYLLGIYKKLLFKEDVLPGLSKNQQLHYLQATNPEYWISITKTQRSRLKKYIYEIYSLVGSDYHLQGLKAISEKVDKLLNTDKNCVRFPTPENNKVCTIPHVI